MLLFSILLLSAGTAIAQPTPIQSTGTEVTQQVPPDQDLEKLREACEKALAEAARAEAEGQTPQSIDPVCEQFSKVDPADEDADIVIVVTGTRTERSLIDSTAAISVIEREQIEGQQVREIDDLIRYEPGISVSNNLQFGLQDFNIRGVGGNRVLIQVDGIRLPTAFQFGNRFNIAQGFNIGRDYFDTETLQRLEIIRGPASAVYGSEALGGVVSYLTLAPGDLLDAIGKNSYSEVSSGYSSENEGFTNTAIQALRIGDVDLLLSFTRRDGFSIDNVMDNQVSERNSFLGKLVYNLTETSSINLTGEVFDDTVDFTTASVNLPLISSTTSFYTEEIETQRTRFNIDYTYDNKDSNNFLNFARTRFYWQDAKTTEENRRDLLGFDFSRPGPPATFPAQRVSNNSFNEEVVGGDVLFRSDFNIGSTSHQVTYGVDVSTTFNSRPRQRVQTNLNTGVETTRAIPDDFPLKDFPDTNTFRLGVYVQDEIEFGGNRWALIPGLRFDYYDLKTSPDEDFGRNGAQAADFNGSFFSPSIGILYRASDQISLFGRYSRGFRAPLYSEINSGFSNQIFGYTTLPNPDLEAESSNSFEAGIRGDTGRFNFSLVGFYNDYDNFIEFQQVGTTPINGRDFLLFQTRNIGKARTYGLEATGEYRFSSGSDGLSLITSIGWTIGDNLTDDQPLASVDPFEAVVGFRYQAPENRWGAELLGTFVGEARGNDFVDGTGFIPDAYILVDLLGYVNITPNLRFNISVFNIFDTEYFRYSDVRFLNTEDDLFEQRRDRRAQPGTSVRVGLSFQF
ncbi:MAG: TonB-dependent hemoglobin/transferrin/lactoferrin family receptor [Prochloron sp. SP5CPC1]|nr:TonB-dependent hemoglobin/transferrin/lactoferrin family receptor [Candidatus Paraprochloron terpiosi SP5CPC1]